MEWSGGGGGGLGRNLVWTPGSLEIISVPTDSPATFQRFQQSEKKERQREKSGKPAARTD